MIEKLMRQLGDDSDPDGPHTFIYKLFLVCVSLGLAILTSFVGFISIQVWNHNERLSRDDIEMSSVVDVVGKIDRHLESIDARYLDLSSSSKAAEGALETKESEITSLRSEAAEGRASLTATVHELSERVDRENAALASRIQQLENIIAPLRDGHRT